MVRKSLIAKVYVYAFGAFLVFLPLTFFASQALWARGRAEGHMEGMNTLLTNQAVFVADELQGQLHAGQLDDARLKRLSHALTLQLDPVPWNHTQDYPAGLAAERVVMDERPEHGLATPPGPPAPRGCWVRVEDHGKPLYALHVRHNIKRPLHHPPSPLQNLPFTVGWLALVAATLVPPLVFWVLRPLREMVAVANRLGEGKLDQPVRVDRADEFGELEQAFESLRRRIQQMLAQRERLLTDISHEVRGPLARMNLVVPLLRQAGAPEDLANLLESEIRDVDAMVGNVLDYVRGRKTGAVTGEPLDLSTIAGDLLSRRRMVFDERDFQLAAVLDEAPVKGDPRLLASAMGNLLDNALKYTQPGGTIRVETGTAGGRAFFRVHDDGPGIPAADLPHVFEPFYRPDTSRSRETGGTGLGLAIVKVVAESHDGEARLSSEEGRGTTAELRLPATAEAVAADATIV
jgi:signal transduction histidine kinase